MSQPLQQGCGDETIVLITGPKQGTYQANGPTRALTSSRLSMIKLLANYCITCHQTPDLPQQGRLVVVGEKSKL